MTIAIRMYRNTLSDRGLEGTGLKLKLFSIYSIGCAGWWECCWWQQKWLNRQLLVRVLAIDRDNVINQRYTNPCMKDNALILLRTLHSCFLRFSWL